MKTVFLAISALLLSLTVASNAFADIALATTKNCLACHAVEKKVLGPSFKDVAAKYADKPDAVAKLAEKIVKGGVGVWGPVPMPSNTQVNAAEATKLATWIMNMK